MTPNELGVDWQRLKENDQTHKLISKHTKSSKRTLILYKMCACFVFYIYIYIKYETCTLFQGRPLFQLVDSKSTDK